MKKTAIIAIAGLATFASADVLIDIDLSVVDELTITATSGLSAVSVSGSNFTGFLFAGLNGGVSGTAGTSVVSADFSTAANASDGSPSVFIAGGGTDSGVNIWSFSTDSTVSVTAGSVAFAGTATWTISSGLYADLLAGATSGDIFLPADDSGDIPSAELLGTYRVVPAPSAMALLGLGGIVAGRRRR
jgi:hypothetical protein